MGLRRVLLVPDVHVPYHDQRAWSLMLKVGHSLRLDTVVCLGDLIDNYAVSQHDKTHLRLLDWQWEIDEARVAVRELERLAPRRIFCAGNHEDRWPRYLAKVAPADNRQEVNGIPSILGLGSRWTYVPYREHARIGKLYLMHDSGRCGKYASNQTLDDVQNNVAFGHTHRLAVVYAGDAVGNRHVGASLGWLGDVEQIDYMHKVRARRDWQLGFGVAYLESSGVAHVTPVPIIGYRCVVEGRLYT